MKKLLQSRLVVGILAATALAALALNLLEPSLRKRRQRQAASALATGLPMRPESPAPAAKLAPAAELGTQTAARNPEPAAQALVPLDRAYFATWFPQRLKQKLRNPFLRPQSGGSNTLATAATEVLELQAIWRQSDGFFVAINGEIVTEGDAFRGFTVTSIQSDRVLVRGPHGVEELHFISGNAPPPPHAPANPPPAPAP
jgi:hypothetical protein